MWKVASRSHITQEFRFTSQPLSVALTDQKSIGGRAWPNVRFADSRYDSAFSLWGNCTLGLLLFWWRSIRQQSGRGAMTINGIESLPVLAFRALSDDQLATAEAIFNDFCDRELKPPTSPTPIPTAPSSTAALSATCWASTKASIGECAASPPSGAPNPPSTAANPAPRTRNW